MVSAPSIALSSVACKTYRSYEISYKNSFVKIIIREELYEKEHTHCWGKDEVKMHVF